VGEHAFGKPVSEDVTGLLVFDSRISIFHFRKETFKMTEKFRRNSVRTLEEKEMGMYTKFVPVNFLMREAARRVCTPDEIVGAIGLINHLGKACFIQGLHNERIQTIVRSRGESILMSQAIEISFEEESGILSTKEKSPASARGPPLRCNRCHKLGHTANKCLSSSLNPSANIKAINCSYCGRDGSDLKHYENLLTTNAISNTQHNELLYALNYAPILSERWHPQSVLAALETNMDTWDRMAVMAANSENAKPNEKVRETWSGDDITRELTSM
jgi:hypothetical protein